MRVLVIGAAGQLGAEVVDVLRRAHEVFSATRSGVDIADLSQVRSLVNRVSPQVIVNTAAYTDVDGCESNRERAFLVNAIGARNVAIAAREAGAVLVHISTDYVFDGEKPEPYVEYDPPRPLSVYGWSKLVGEQMAMAQHPRTFLLRVAWLYGPRRRNFVKTMLKLAREREEIRVVNDQRGTPTFVGDVARQIERLIGTDSYGLYHCTSQGSCTRFEFALEIFKCAGYEAEAAPDGSFHLIPKPESLTPRTQDLRPNTQDLRPSTQHPRPITLRPVTSDEFPTPAKRPANSVLENFMLKVQGLDNMPHWRESLAAQIRRIKEAVEE